MSLQQQLMGNEQEQRIAAIEKTARRLHRNNRIGVAILLAFTMLVALVFLSIIISLLIRGFPMLVNPRFYGTSAAYSIGKELFNTFYILFLTELFLIPISLAAAVYMIEYAPQGRLVTAIHFASDTLAGVPSLVLGLFGYAVFCTIFGFGLSRIAGALTLLCLNFPIALRLFEDALTSVSREQREGGLALGGTRWYMIRTVVLPSALAGIVTGIVLTAGKIVAEAAALIFTMGTSNPANVFTLNPFIGSDNLTVYIYNVQTTGLGLSKATADAISSGSSALLIVILLVISFGVRGISRAVEKRITRV